MIDRIVIDNFKSIKHADVKLQKINLLIGPNNSGKSNFLKLFEVIKNQVDSYNNYTISRIVTKEGLALSAMIILSESRIHIDTGLRIMPQNKETNPSKISFFNKIRYSHLYKIQIDTLKQSRNLDLSADFVNGLGDNIASFLQIALNKHRNIFEKITSDLLKFTIGFKEIVLDLIPDRQIRFGLKNEADHIFWSDELSEGVLYFLCILCIVNQPNPPKYLFIEEPETGIHPRRIKEVIDLIRQLSIEKDIQVIMTTHSPLVVDLFANEPESIHVFEMKDGFTEIKNLKTDILDPINKELEESGIEPRKDYDTTLGQQWVYGFLGQ
ncbi:MAG: AAA family ATPase [Flavobacterium sp.]|nr:AAA family ATPase [Flavobacterium sp.]